MTLNEEIKVLSQMADTILARMEALAGQFDSNTDLQLAVQRVNRRMHDVACDLAFLGQ